jgi:hypothetical protein
MNARSRLPALWLADFESELFSLPGGRYDDQIDSISQGLSPSSIRLTFGRMRLSMVSPDLMRFRSFIAVIPGRQFDNGAPLLFITCTAAASLGVFLVALSLFL